MSWQDTLTTLLNLAMPVASAIEAGQGLTFESAWNDPAIKDLREKLVTELTQADATEHLIEASQKLSEQAEALQKRSTLAPDDLKKLGVLTGMAYKLSAQALASAATPQAIFQYTIEELLPWLQHAVDVGVIVASAVKTKNLEPDRPAV